MTRDQAQTSKDRAARFVRNVLNDPDKADDIEDESLDGWAERKKISITNPGRKRGVCTLIDERGTTMAKKNPSNKELQDRIDELEQENDELQDALDQISDLAAGGDDDDDGNGDDQDDDGDDDQN